jgi:hypothetical protein
MFCFVININSELKKRMEFIPEHLTLLWRIKHTTVNTKICQPFHLKILDGNHVSRNLLKVNKILGLG